MLALGGDSVQSLFHIVTSELCEYYGRVRRRRTTSRGPMDGHPMVNSWGKIRGPPKRLRILWTAGWVEPGDKWMMLTILVAAITQGWSPLLTYQCNAIYGIIKSFCLTCNVMFI